MCSVLCDDGLVRVNVDCKKRPLSKVRILTFCATSCTFAKLRRPYPSRHCLLASSMTLKHGPLATNHFVPRSAWFCPRIRKLVAAHCNSQFRGKRRTSNRTDSVGFGSPFCPRTVCCPACARQWSVVSNQKCCCHALVVLTHPAHDLEAEECLLSTNSSRACQVRRGGIKLRRSQIWSNYPSCCFCNVLLTKILIEASA